MKYRAIQYDLNKWVMQGCTLQESFSKQKHSKNNKWSDDQLREALKDIYPR